MKEELIEQQETEELSEEGLDVANELMQSVNKISHDEEGTHQIFFNNDILNKLGQKSEGISLENEMLGIKVSMVSKTTPINKLKCLAEDSMLFMMNKMPCKLPLGVG